MIDVLELRSRLETLLAAHLGTYTFSTGDVTPAMRVDDGSDPYEEEPAIAGLEVVIRPEQSISITSFLAGDKLFAAQTEIVLKQWDSTQNTRAAREILIRHLDIERVGPLIPRNGYLQNLETFTITLSDSFHFLRSHHG